MVNRTLIIFAALIAGIFADTTCTSDQVASGCCSTSIFDVEPAWSFNETGGHWTSTVDYIRYDIMDDVSCGGTADMIQSGTAELVFTVSEEMNVIMDMEGMAESSYETYSLYVDGALVVTVQANDSDTCQVSTCNMCEVQMAPRTFSLSPGEHHFRVEITTIDHLYHSSAYFQISFRTELSEVCGDCTCPMPSMSPSANPTESTLTVSPSMAPSTSASPTAMPTASTTISDECLESAADCPDRCAAAFGASHDTFIEFEGDVCKCNTESTITELAGSADGQVNIDLQILLDATGSMGEALNAMSQSMIQMIDNIQTDIKAETGFDAILRVGAVAYRDPHWDPPAENEHIAFTTSNSEIDAFLASLQPMGGGDLPEDVNGGLVTMLDQEWTSEHKFIVHITDAGMLGEDGPDPAGIMYQDLFNVINERAITYVIGRMHPRANNMIANFNEVYAVNDAGIAVDPSEASIDVLDLEGMGAEELSAVFTTELVSTIVSRVSSRKITTTLAEWNICPATTTEAPASCPSNVFVSTADCLTDELCQRICEHEDGSLCPETACKCETVFNEYASACCGGHCHDDYEELWRANHHNSFRFTIEGVDLEWDRTIEGCQQICYDLESCDAFNVVEDIRCEIIAGYTFMEPGSTCETCFLKVSHSELPTTTTLGVVDLMLPIRRNLRSAQLHRKQ